MIRRIDPVAIVDLVCRTVAEKTAIYGIGPLVPTGVIAAVADRDTPALFDWLVGMFAYQGISDTAAATYIAAHGNVTYRRIAASLSESRCPCPLLAGFDDYRHCGFRKRARTCSHPNLLPWCPVPTHDLRKGSLNQLAYSLFFFVRDICGGDLVGFIDKTFGAADRPGDPDRVGLMQAALVEPLRTIHGVSNKLINMAFADLLLAADPGRSRWVEVGASMIAVDSLVHNFLVRTGILDRVGARHEFGPGCYRDRGCAPIIDRVARKIDARTFDPSFPVYFPRFIQHSVWAFCSQQGLDLCNGNRIDDRVRCAVDHCPARRLCGRVTLRGSPPSIRSDRPPKVPPNKKVRARPPPAAR